MGIDWVAEVKGDDEDGASRYILEHLDDPDFQRGYELAAQRRHLLESLRQRRRAKGLSQQDLARMLGTTQSVISDIERGRKDSKLWTLLRLAEALDAYITFEVRDLGGEARDDKARLMARARDAVAVLTGDAEVVRTPA